MFATVSVELSVHLNKFAISKTCVLSIKNQKVYTDSNKFLRCDTGIFWKKKKKSVDTWLMFPWPLAKLSTTMVSAW